MDWWLAVAGLGVGIIVGLTGMGGGALMTPILVLFFGVPPLAAVSSDLVASAVMKPVGSLVHIRRGRVDWRLVGWLCLGSVPAAFCGVIVSKSFGSGQRVQNVVQTALGIALLLAVIGLVLRAYMRLRETRSGAEPAGITRVRVRVLPTVVLGAIGGLVVGMTSVGSGSLIIVVLLALYPMLRPNDLVGTDLVQAVPLVTAAALGHLLFGDFRFSVTAALLIGSVPGAFIGALISSRAPGGLVRRALAVVLFASALKLLHATNTQLIIGVAAALILSTAGWRVIRRVAAPRTTATSVPAPVPAPALPEPAPANR
ncbi:sulfite exporter TauE/SafE family protein [Hamadaea tsunoensis]|uniref:sulfite exporter TauE/SafE family protein n=1 Tax=Hamadaea tsunoensis TaxID=53368 RepID=UPI000406073D|nr:sulfite exporter TauE/SafE family protein [Hamadaea tsunoensis]